MANRTCPHCKLKHMHHDRCGHAPNRVWDPHRQIYVADTGRSVTPGVSHERVRPGARMSRAEKILLGICIQEGCARRATDARGEFCEAHS